MQNKEKFDPENDLERKLMAAQGSKAGVETLMRELLASKVFILVDKDPGHAGGWDQSASPMILSSSSGFSVLAIFTAASRAIGWNAEYPEFEFGMHVDFRWLVKGVADGVGIVINPGWAVGMEVSPGGVERLKKDAHQAG